MTRATMRLFLMCILAGFTLPVLAQEQGAQQGKGGVIEIEAQVVNTRLELPQVQIYDKRKKVKFDEVKVEKDFKSELSGKNEELKFTPITSGKIKPIKNIQALLAKKRF